MPVCDVAHAVSSNLLARRCHPFYVTIWLYCIFVSSGTDATWVTLKKDAACFKYSLISSATAYKLLGTTCKKHNGYTPLLRSWTALPYTESAHERIAWLSNSRVLFVPHTCLPPLKVNHALEKHYATGYDFLPLASFMMTLIYDTKYNLLSCFCKLGTAARVRHHKTGQDAPTPNASLYRRTSQNSFRSWPSQCSARSQGMACSPQFLVFQFLDKGD